MLVSIVKGLLTVFLTFVLLTAAPGLLLGAGTCLALIGKLLGMLLKGSPVIFFILSVIISILHGLKVFLTSK